MFYQRIHAFLLRRILGPYLTAESCAKLHSCIEVAVSEGRYVLWDVELRGDMVAELLGLASDADADADAGGDENNDGDRGGQHGSAGSGNLTVCRATVRRLAVVLSFRDSEETSSNTAVNGTAPNGSGGSGVGAASHPYRRSESAPPAATSSASVAPATITSTLSSTISRTARLGTLGGGVSLIAAVEIDGLEIDLAPVSIVPSSSQRTPPSSSTTDQDGGTAAATAGGGGLLASYVDAAMKSLRLSAELSGMCLRILSKKTRTNDAPWVGVRLQSLKYHDLTVLPDDASSVASGSPVLRKEVEFNGLVFEVGGNKDAQIMSMMVNGASANAIEKNDCVEGVENTDNNKFHRKTIAEMKGSGDIKILVHAITVSHPTSKTNSIASAAEVSRNKDSTKGEITRLRNDIDLRLGDSRLDVCLDRRSLEHVSMVINAMNAPDESIDVTALKGGQDEDMEHMVFDEASDVKALSDMMRQYAEARHMARTQQIRGGIMLPTISFDGDDENGTLEFDTFFDANDQSFCAFRSMMEDSADRTGVDDFVHTRVSFGFFETTLKVIWGSSESEYVSLTVGEIKANATQSAAGSNLDLALSYLEVEDSYEKKDANGRTITDVGNILRFIDDGASGENQLPDEGCVLSSSPCLSLNLCRKIIGKDRTDTAVDLFLHTLEVTHRPSIHSIVSSLQSLSEATFGDEEDDSTEKGNSQVSPRKRAAVISDSVASRAAQILRFALHIPTVTVFLPLSADDDFARRDLFDRCGYTVPTLSGCESTSMGLVFADVTLDISNHVVVPEKNPMDRSVENITNDGSIGIKTTSVSCQNAIVFVATPLRGGTSREFHVLDICAISSESIIEANSAIKVQYSERVSLDGIDRESTNSQTKSLSQKGNFPLVPPLSAVKAQQQFEADEVDDIYRTSGGEASVSLPIISNTASMKITDPQYAMSAESNACATNIEVEVPSLVIDMGRKEISCLVRLLEIFSNTSAENCGATPGPEKCFQPSDASAVHSSSSGTKGGTGVSFCFDQISIALHGDAEEGIAAPAYVAILDRAKAHVLANSSGGIRHTRFLLQDVTLYEANGLGLSHSSETMELGASTGLLAARCIEVRRRGMRCTATSHARSLCYRSKLSRPLSPETPAVIFDVINRSYVAGDFDDEDDEEEREVHLLVYDMTCRYDSTFDPSNLLSILSFGDDAAKQDDDGDTKSQSTNADGSSSLTNLFVTFSDCALDYSSPDDFVRASRCLIRVSEVRASSNIVLPHGQFQAYKLSMGDVSVHLASARFPYNAENILLSCSTTILAPKDLLVGTVADSGHGGSGAFSINTAIPIDATLRRMKFIQIATLDSIDALVVIANGFISPTTCDSTAEGKSKKESPVRRPNTTATLSLGQMNLYACQDSFNCLTDTIGEWVLHYTTPSADQIEQIKASLDRTEIDDDQKSQLEKSASASSPSRSGLSAATGCSVHTKTDVATSGPSHEGFLLDKIDNDMFVSKATAFSNGSTCMNQEDDDDLDDNELFSSFDELPPPSTALKGFEGTLSFTEDEDEWLAVDYEWSNDTSIPAGKDQAARWLSSTSSAGHVRNGIASSSVQNSTKMSRKLKSPRGKSSNNVKIVPQHVPIQALSDPLSTGDMDAAKFAGTDAAPPVDTRIIVKDCSVNLRFFDGFDWPELQEEEKRARKSNDSMENKSADRKSKLLSELLQSNEGEMDNGCPGNASSTSKKSGSSVQSPLSRKIEPRQASKFFQLTGQKMKLRIDSFEELKNHRLASCVDLSLNDLFLAETISGDKPVKILGEWFNEAEHPRDTGDGILMMKMVSMHPANQISADGKYMSDESRVAMELLPLRFFVYQTALRFIRDFFCGPSVAGDGDSDGDAQEQDSDEPSGGDDNNNKSLLIQDNGNDEILVSPTFFHSFKIRPCKLKVDYRPERLDTAALRDGSYVELVNLLPLEEMILTLKPVEIKKLTSWSSVFGEIARRWIEDICATQMHKFLTKSRPFQPFSSVGAAGKDLVMIPLQEYKQDGNIIKGIRDSTSALAGTVAYEALNTSAKVTRYAANRLSGVSRGGKASDYSSASGESHIMVSLPSRPDEVPSSFVDVSGHAFDSLTAGLREANYKIVYIPYKEYRRKGASGAAKSVVKGIPVAVRAPLSGASEALSYTLLGVRNQLRPDMMKEEKANLRGLSSDF